MGLIFYDLNYFERLVGHWAWMSNKWQSMSYNLLATLQDCRGLGYMKATAGYTSELWFWCKLVDKLAFPWRSVMRNKKEIASLICMSVMCDWRLKETPSFMWTRAFMGSVYTAAVNETETMFVKSIILHRGYLVNLIGVTRILTR